MSGREHLRYTLVTVVPCLLIQHPQMRVRFFNPIEIQSSIKKGAGDNPLEYVILTHASYVEIL